MKVKPAQLPDYLQQQKAQGYTVIGVEQTARSADLTQYCFPEKSLLLLGYAGLCQQCLFSVPGILVYLDSQYDP